VSLLSYLLRSAEVRLDYIVDGTNLTGTTCSSIIFIALSLDIDHSNEKKINVDYCFSFACSGVDTNQDGVFEIHIATESLTGPQHVVITPSKISSGVTHSFDYNGDPIQNLSVYVDFLDFNKAITFIDTTVGSVSGVISISDTAAFNGDSRCPISNATVCLLDPLQGGKALECDLTDEQGVRR
jgi:hypothetical protein